MLILIGVEAATCELHQYQLGNGLNLKTDPLSQGVGCGRWRGAYAVYEVIRDSSKQVRKDSGMFGSLVKKTPSCADDSTERGNMMFPTVPADSCTFMH